MSGLQPSDGKKRDRSKIPPPFYKANPEKMKKRLDSFAQKDYTES